MSKFHFSVVQASQPWAKTCGCIVVQRSAMSQIEFNAVAQKPLESITHRADTVFPKQHQTLKQAGFKSLWLLRRPSWIH
jgi:hypothetical protein